MKSEFNIKEKKYTHTVVHMKIKRFESNYTDGTYELTFSFTHIFL